MSNPESPAKSSSIASFLLATDEKPKPGRRPAIYDASSEDGMSENETDFDPPAFNLASKTESDAERVKENGAEDENEKTEAAGDEAKKAEMEDVGKKAGNSQREEDDLYRDLLV